MNRRVLLRALRSLTSESGNPVVMPSLDNQGLDEQLRHYANAAGVSVDQVLAELGAPQGLSNDPNWAARYSPWSEMRAIWVFTHLLQRALDRHVTVGDNRLRQVASFSGRGVAERKRMAAIARATLMPAIDDYHNRHPEASNNEIARALHAQHGKGKSVEALAKQISRLRKRK
jgi:hypothetical protein